MNSYLFKIIKFLKIMFLFLFCSVLKVNLKTTLVSAGELAAWPLFYLCFPLEGAVRSL